MRRVFFSHFTRGTSRAASSSQIRPTHDPSNRLTAGRSSLIKRPKCQTSHLSPQPCSSIMTTASGSLTQDGTRKRPMPVESQKKLTSSRQLRLQILTMLRHLKKHKNKNTLSLKKLRNRSLRPRMFRPLSLSTSSMWSGAKSLSSLPASIVTVFSGCTT